MKTLGIIGGIAPESTIAYYRLLVDSYRQKNPDGNYPSLIKNEENIHGLILGGTELPLILRDETYNKIPLLDTARIHVEQAVTQLLS